MRRPIAGPVTITGDRASHAVYGVGPATDYAVPVGTPVVAPFAGALTGYLTVEGGLSARLVGTDATFFGQHLSERAPAVRYAEGDQIALSGNTGVLTTGPHLHCYVIVHATGERLSMEEYLTQLAGGDAEPFQPDQPAAEEETLPVNIILYLYVPTNKLLLVDHLNKTIRDLGSSATDPVRAHYATLPYTRAYDAGDSRIGVDGIDWAKAATGYRYV